MPDDATQRPQDTDGATLERRRPRVMAIGAAVLALLGGGALGLYGIAARTGKAMPHTGACAQSLDRAAAIESLIHGEIAGLAPATTPQNLAPVSFDDGDGQRTTVAAFKGRTLLLNLWATWCVPCRAEMPSLDKLQAALGSTRFEVVPVNVDTVRLEKPRAFLKDIGATNLPFYSDRSADILQALKQTGPISGLPTSILIGQDGCAIATMAGPADWDSGDAKALIAKASS